LRFSDRTTPTLCTDGASVHLVLKDFSPNCLCLFLHNRRIDRCFPLTKALVHPVLKSLSWRVCVFIQTRHRIDQRCPMSDHPVLPSLLLFLFHSSCATRKHTVGSSDGPCKTGLPSRSVPSAPTLAPMVPSVHPTVSLSFLFFSIWHVVFWHAWDLDMSTKTC
jgi:hypothetical protein